MIIVLKSEIAYPCALIITVPTEDFQLYLIDITSLGFIISEQSFSQIEQLKRKQEKARESKRKQEKARET